MTVIDRPPRCFRTAIAATLLTIALAVAAGSVDRASAATVTGFTPEQAAAVDSIVSEEMASDRIPGVNVAIYAPGKRFESSYGLSDLTTAAAMDPDDSIRIASISKAFTAVAVLRLIDKRRLRLTDTVDEYVDGVPDGNRINIRKLLGMTAGVYDFTMDDQFNAAFSANPLYPGWEPTDVLPILEAHGPDFPPGQMVSYSDSNYILLGLVIEQVTGKPVRQVINRLARIAGLGHTTFPTTAALPKPFAHGYYAGDAGTGPLQDYTAVNPDVPWTAGNMLSTIADLKRWSRLLGTGTLLSDRLFGRQTAFRPIPNPGGPSIGYGLGIFKLGDWIGHNGAIYGFNTAMFFLPSANARILISGNKSTNFSTESTEMFLEMAEVLFPGSVSIG